MNESLLRSLQISTESEVALKQLDEKGFSSIFDIVKEPLEQFCCTMEELSGEQAELIHAAACKRVEALESIHRTLRSRNEPVMQSIPKLGIAPFPQELQVAMGRSLGGAVDFDDLFDERSGAGYAEVTSIQSLFSPGRYLVELYRIAQGLHSDSSPLHIDNRRPDIKNLILDETNLVKEISTLDILNETLLKGMQASSGAPDLQTLETVWYPMTLPYHDNLVQVRSVLSANKLSLVALWSALADDQMTAFNAFLEWSSGSLLADVTPSPRSREQLEIAPELYSLLVNSASNEAAVKRHYNLAAQEDIAGKLKSVDEFIARTGLSFNQLIGMTAQADYSGNVVANLMRSVFWRYGDIEPVNVDVYGQTYLSDVNSDPASLLVCTAEANKLELKLSGDSKVIFCDRAQRLIRLQRQVDLEFHELDWLIMNANRALHKEQVLRLDSQVLSTLAEFTRLSTKYGISCDEFCCFLGDMNTYARQSEQSLYQRLFTSTIDSTTLALNATLNFDSAVHSAQTAIVCGALKVSADELQKMAGLAFEGASLTAVTMNSTRYAQLYRLAMIPRMLGLSFTEADLLWELLNPGKDTARRVAREATLDTLEIIRQTEAVLAWMVDNQLDVRIALSMTSEVYSSVLTPELHNFTHNIYTSLINDSAASTRQANAPLSPKLQQRLYQAIAPAFKSKSNIMAKLLQWQDSFFRMPDGITAYGLGDFWADVKRVHGNEPAEDASQASANMVRYSQGMAQYALIAQWADLTEQDLNLIVDQAGFFTLVSISSSVGDLSPGRSGEVTFTFSEDPGSSFTASNVVLNNATLGPISGTGTSRTATVTSNATNIISNGSFTGGATGWGTSGTVFLHGNGHMTFESGASVNGVIQQNVTTVEGETYVVQFWVRGHNNTYSACRATAQALDGATVLGSLETAAFAAAATVKFTFVATSTTTTIKLIETRDDSSNEYYFDDFVVARVPTVTVRNSAFMDLAAKPSMPLLLRIARLKQWLLRTVVPASEAIDYFEKANQPGQTSTKAIDALAMIHGWDSKKIALMNSALVNQQTYSAFPTCFDDVCHLETWMLASAHLNVGGNCIDQLYRMSKSKVSAQESDLIRSVAEQLTATIKH